MKLGYRVRPASSAALAAAVERLMDDPDEAQQLAAAARRKVVAKYNLVTNVERLAVEFRTRLPCGPGRC